MFKYQASPLPQRPYSDQQRLAALDGLRNAGKYSDYGQNQMDIMSSAGNAAAAEFDASAYKTNSAFEQERNQARQQLALSGLKQMVDAQDQNAQLQTQRLGMYNSFLNPILGGLFS